MESNGVKSTEHEGQEIGPTVPIHGPGSFVFKIFLNSLA